jgi:hypothetical protein
VADHHRYDAVRPLQRSTLLKHVWRVRPVSRSKDKGPDPMTAAADKDRRRRATPRLVRGAIQQGETE